MKTLAKHIDLWLISVLLLAGVMHLSFLGLYQLSHDEIEVLFWSQWIARHREWIPHFNNRFANDWRIAQFPLVRQLPLVNYLVAIPYQLNTQQQNYAWTIMGSGYPLRSVDITNGIQWLPIAKTGTRVVRLNHESQWDKFNVAATWVQKK